MPLIEKSKDWQELTQLTRGQKIVVERVRIPEKNMAIEGSFELPQLARLQLEDQVFIVAFVRSHGSIKEMERVFGISYPTVKSRLTRGREMLRQRLTPYAREVGQELGLSAAILDNILDNAPSRSQVAGGGRRAEVMP